MFGFLKNCIMVSLVVALAIVSAVYVQAEEKEEGVLAKSEFFSVTRDDIALLRERMKSFFQTTEKEYCRALIKFKLLSKEARDQKIDQEPRVAAELNQMIEQKLFDIYVDRLMDGYELLPGTIESYYDSRPDEFTLEDGTLVPLNDDVRKEIRKMFMEAKRSEIVNNEMTRLMKKHSVEIIDPVCEAKDASND